jgi:formylglycine-generating enzyme required for sulfatase activity
MRSSLFCLTVSVVCCAAPGAPVDDPSLITNRIDIQLRRIEPGSFMMGSTYGDRDEQPIHKVTIERPFYMGVHEVTQAQWREVMGTNPSHFASERIACRPRPNGNTPVARGRPPSGTGATSGTTRSRGSARRRAA